MNNEKKWIYGIGVIFFLLFAVLIGKMVYLTVIERKVISVHPYNTRLNHLEKEVIRGKIYSADEQILATNEQGERVYPKGSSYAHLIGYSTHGKTGVEALVNTQLLYPNYTLTSIFENAFKEQKFTGQDVVLTVDDRYQQAIYDTMEAVKGAAVVLEPSTGQIKALYSGPTFNPNKLADIWDGLTTDTKNTPLVNRVTYGLYPPGSIFKTVSTLAFLQNNANAKDFTYVCNGTIQGENYTIQCYDQREHGKIDLQEAYAKSCNTYFVKLSKLLSTEQLKTAAEKMGFNQKISAELETKQSRFQLLPEDTAFEKAATFIGQGKTLVTPMHMAMIASSIVNDGVLMRPYVYDYTTNEKGKVKNKQMPHYEKAYMTEEEAKQIEDLMIQVVQNGTAQSLQRKGMIVGGKTGTAENETKEDHSWFIGFAKPKDESKEPIAFAIIIESGGGRAVNVAESIIDIYQEIE